MKLENKHYWAIGAGVILITAGVILYRVNKKKKQENEALNGNNRLVEDTEHTELSASEEAAEINKGEENAPFPLKFGSENKMVKSVQKYMNSVCSSNLKKEGVFPLLLDGKWGTDTDKASLACKALKRNQIDEESFNRIKRDLESANIS
tara:strand:- start:8052 stop:8498 length:447 start_codon:yes stop_codon:yes gene_type:complete